ncbi:Protein of unknown function DUF4817 [Trinorchestia longiramus]|nr:Protein of unknown function DUF4817 [Trinorchestia longiramus]
MREVVSRVQPMQSNQIPLAHIAEETAAGGRPPIKARYMTRLVWASAQLHAEDLTGLLLHPVVGFLFDRVQHGRRSLPIIQLKKEQRTFIVEKYFAAKSFQQVIQSFQEHFPERQSPTKMTIWRNGTRYRTEGTSLNLNKGRSGRKRTGRSEENVRIVQGALTENPQISARKSGLDVTKSTFNRIITLDSKLHPYKMHVRNAKN